MPPERGGDRRKPTQIQDVFSPFRILVPHARRIVMRRKIGGKQPFGGADPVIAGLRPVD
jgi:hypothetical protein